MTSRFPGSQASRLSRRGFLKATLATATGFVGCASDDEPPREPAGAARYFPQSVASGDPRPNSVVLWTRVLDRERPDTVLEVELTVGLDAAFSELVEFDGAPAVTLRADPEFDHCVKVRVDGLVAGRTYFYRFHYRSAAGVVPSRVGRTKTAPAPEADAPVRFGVACCQDYDDKYFHASRLLAESDLDFVVHLGDYVYESGRATAAGPRRVVFTRPEEALSISGSLKARSVDNYRDLYRTYRSDPDLQALHENVPVIAIWDDHEFANDCHGATATDTNGRSDDADSARRAAADKAWFEYMPVDYDAGPASAWDPLLEFPDDLSIYRSFAFGRHLELVMTDLRRYPPDPVVPEDAFPGAIFATEEELRAGGLLAGELVLVPAVDVDTFADGAYRAVLRERARELDYRADAVTGLVSAPFINALLEEMGDGAPPPIDVEDPELPRGCAYHQLLKTAGFSAAGARYLLALEPYLALAGMRHGASGGDSERLMGEQQRQWFLDTLRGSTRTFKVWGSSFCFMPRTLDLRAASVLPEEYRQRLLITADDWDGSPNERRLLLGELAAVDNVIVLSGDLHCFFAGTPFDPERPENRLVEFVTGSVSSSTWLREIRAIAESDASLPESVALAAGSVGTLLSDPVSKPNPHLAYQELERNGVTVFDVDAAGLHAELFLLSPDDVLVPPGDLPGPLTSHFARVSLRVPAGTRELWRDVEGTAYRWNTTDARWVLAG